MQCPQCQTEVLPQASFCYQCGARLSSGDAAEAAAGNATASLAPRGAASPKRDDAEKELWQGSYSPKATLPAFAAAGAASVVLIAVAAILAFPGIYWLWVVLAIIVVFAGIGLKLWLTRLSTAYRLTTQRLMHETGLLRRVTNRLEVIDIDDVTIEQGLIDRFLQIGTIKLTSSDRTHPVLQLRGVEEVRTVADQIDQARRNERVRRGLHIEAV